MKNGKNRLGAELGACGVVMFPTTHDIVPTFLGQCLVTLKNLLRENQVLIVTKPHLSVVRTLCRELAADKARILFRFTIGSLDKKLCAFWEPGAPPPAERLAALEHAWRCGFSTSISIEPMLDTVEATLKLVAQTDPHVTDTIWIGKMQRIPVKQNAHVPGFTAARTLIRQQQCDAEILRLVASLQAHPKVKWKDSIQAVMAKTTPVGPGKNSSLRKRKTPVASQAGNSPMAVPQIRSSK